MRLNRRIMFFLVIAAVVSGCSGNSSEEEAEGTPGDNSASARCYENFFRDLPRFSDSNSAALLLQDGRKVSMTRFFKEEYMSPVSQYGRKDLDGDGTAELVIYNNTGGAHCCDEFYVFRQERENQFAFTAHLMGSACIDAATSRFSFSLSETFGYFFGCFACGYEDSTGGFKTMREITLKYSNGKLDIIPYTKAQEQQNLHNLEILHAHGFEKLEGQMDNGWRKEFAMNFALWYFNHGKNLQETRKLFDKYYTFKDAAAVWNEFSTTITDAAKENTF